MSRTFLVFIFAALFAFSVHSQTHNHTKNINRHAPYISESNPEKHYSFLSFFGTARYHSEFALIYNIECRKKSKERMEIQYYIDRKMGPGEHNKRLIWGLLDEENREEFENFVRTFNFIWSSEPPTFKYLFYQFIFERSLRTAWSEFKENCSFSHLKLLPN